MTHKSRPVRASKPARPAKATTELRRWLWQREIWGLALLAGGMMSLISLLSPDQGRLSRAWSSLLRQVFGVGVYPVVLLLIAGSILLILWNSLSSKPRWRWQAIVGWEIIFFCGLGLWHALSREDPLRLAQTGQGGGYIGWALAGFLSSLVGPVAGAVLLALAVLAGLYLVLAPYWGVIFWRIRWLLAQMAVPLRGMLALLRPGPASEAQPTAPSTRVAPPKTSRPIPPAATPEQSQPLPSFLTRKASPTAQPPAKPRPAPAPVPTDLPPLDLLNPEKPVTDDEADARLKAQIIEDTLDAFGIPAQVTEWHRGPVVTQFDVEPGYIERPDREGNLHRYKIRVSKILSLANDLALALAASPIRIEAPVPGRAVVGIEVPNETKTLVGLRGVLESEQFQKLHSPLRIALGRDVSGEAVVASLTTMPHLLVAGATGSGKSVCLNAIIASLLFFHRPDELKLLLVDPKRVELTKYNGIPHLLAPVVVDIEKVIVALRWLTQEMDRRYQRFAEAGARNIKAYQKLAAAKGLEPMPFIVVVIDELADLMLTAPDEVERTVCRLAQMARATGIHLVIATQRPSVDVVTGLIKANFPARISFAVTSQVDSRVILDTPGAEKLLGRGDMLFMSPEAAKLQRIQGCFVSDKELDALVAFWRRAALTVGSEAPQPAPWEGMKLEEDDDKELLQQAIALVREHQQASASFLQRQLRIGYPRAARLMDQLEELGIVGPAEAGGRSRSVLDASEPPDEASSLPTDPSP